MSTEVPDNLQRMIAQRVQHAMRLASAGVPHLAGLARLVRLKASRRVSVAAVSASGLVLFNPDVFAAIPLADAAFILAHELMHLALDTHGRQGDAPHLLTNFAHDYIINGILEEELLREPPLGGLREPAYRDRSLEELIIELGQGDASGTRCWTPGRGPGRKRRGSSPRSTITRALEDAGLVERPPPVEIEASGPRLSAGDLIPSDREQELEPEISRELRQKLTNEIRKAAAKAAALGQLKKSMQEASGDPTVVPEPLRRSALFKAVCDAYSAPWELALQRWVDAIAPGERTYARPSRRGQAWGEAVCPGRYRQGWVMHIVLDTSGSMETLIPKALGTIAVFCESANVAEVHLVQCDAEVTADEWVEPEQLLEFKISGFGYSDMSPAMLHLAADPEVQAVLVLTDGEITYPTEEPPYRVLWALIGDSTSPFDPSYGETVRLKGI